jgi:hypothetical protein
MRHVVFVLASIAFAGGSLACGSDEDPNCADSRTPASGHEHTDGEGSYAGRSCLEQGCHLIGNTGPQAPAYHAAGTVFRPDLTTPVPGVVVRFIPLSSAATRTEVVTDQDGNFYVLASEPSPFPSIPEVTACPDVNTMIEGTLDPSYGSCATQSCHSIGSGRGPIFVGDPP